MTDPRRLKGGVKGVWLKQNRQLVVDYWRHFGDADTCKQFSMRPEVLRDLIQGGVEDPRAVRLPRRSDDIEKVQLMAEASQAAVAELRRDIRGLKEDYIQFTELVSESIATKLLKPLLSMIIRLPDDMRPPQELLELVDFPRQARKVKAGKDG